MYCHSEKNPIFIPTKPASQPSLAINSQNKAFLTGDTGLCKD